MVTTGRIHRSSFHHTFLSSSGFIAAKELQDDSDVEPSSSFSGSVDAEEGALTIVMKRGDKEYKIRVDGHV